jgi:ribosomal protein L35AE/L33A
MTKYITTIIGAVVLSVGGTYTYTDKQVGLLETELEAKTLQLASTTESKVLVGKDYVYSQLTSGRLPNLSGALTSTELSEAYLKAYLDNGGDPKIVGEVVELSTEIRKLAEGKGELLKCEK